MSAQYSLENVEELAGGDQEFIAVLVQTFLEEIPPDLASLEEAIDNNNKELAYQFAHKMKPNLEMFGVDVLKDITAIESWTRTSKSVANILPNIGKLSMILHAVFSELQSDFAS